MVEYRCHVHGLVATRENPTDEGPHSCPECGGRILKWVGEGVDLHAEAVGQEPD